MQKASFVLIAGLGAMLTVSGCASKKYVNARIDPVSQRVGELETSTSRQTEELEQVGNDASRADERAVSAGERADEANRQAKLAQRQASQAKGSAAEAMTAAETALNGVDALEDRMDGINDYELVSRHTVIFDFESSELTAEAQKALDKAIDELLLDVPYEVEVRGFTDTTGDRDYNLALSKSRAEAVVRYLTTRHSIPLHRIHMAGLGSETPAADNKSRSGRQQNRRAEVWIYTSEPLPQSAWWR